MKPLLLPETLHKEFETVQAVIRSDGSSKRVDALLLTWVKYEKQLRRLFCFLVFQHASVDKENLEDMVEAISGNNRLYPETFQKGINQLNNGNVADLVGDRYSKLSAELTRIRAYRNKLMHGQITGQRISSRTLERDVHILVDWIAALAAGASQRFGYDGISRNTYRAAKESSKIAISSYPFTNSDEFKIWLTTLTH
jgi:hypothetical protein